jgi:uncharacterized membrane protein YraQ (UPF0718 family)
MSEISQPTPSAHPWHKLDKAWLASAVILALVAVFMRDQFVGVVSDAARSILSTAPFIIFAVCAVAWLKATDAEHLIARAFKGSQTRMILLAALAGGLSPFCSCEVIPFIAAMLALGVPLSAVMAFWLSSPLMDPAMFTITASALGLEFALAKTVAAVGLGMFGGFGVKALGGSGIFADPLKANRATSGCCGVQAPFSGDPVWQFWKHDDRRALFGREALSNGLFLLKWLTLAYLLEAIMIRTVPAELVAGYLGSDGLQPIFLGAVLGGPAYLNGYAAVPLVAGLMEQGMSAGAALSFMIAGGVSSIPAAMAVYALVKTRVFATYLGFALIGSILSGLIWSVIA